LLVSTRLFNYRRNQYKALVDQQAAAAALEWLATTDSLTGVLNRRSFLAAAEREMARFKRHGHVFSLLIIDLDHFKDLNDTHGHPAGDHALRGFTDLVKRIGRGADIFGRLGGEEFGLLMPETTLADARLAAERLRRHVQALELSLEGRWLKVTLSGGLVQVTPADANFDSLMRRADQALYRAKDAGRNQIDSAE
jgi:diguanylate cyclase (GGDEF)-like protein